MRESRYVRTPKNDCVLMHIIMMCNFIVSSYFEFPFEPSSSPGCVPSVPQMTSFLAAFLQCQRTGGRPSRRRRGARLGRSSSSSRRGVGGSEGDDLVEGGGGGGGSSGGGGGDDEAVEVRVSHRLHGNEIHVVVVSRRGRRRKGGRTPSVMNALVTPGLSSAISSHSGTIRIERRPAAAGISSGRADPFGFSTVSKGN